MPPTCAYRVAASNVVIKDGVLGRSSHHGIHGNDVHNVRIHNVEIKDFEVAGIALNGFVDLELTDVSVGPVNQAVPVMGVYGQARILLPRLRQVVRDNPDGTVRIHARGSLTMGEVVEELVAQMDLVFNHVINAVAYEDMEDQERVQQARRVFENASSLRRGFKAIAFDIGRLHVGKVFIRTQIHNLLVRVGCAHPQSPLLRASNSPLCVRDIYYFPEISCISRFITLTASAVSCQ